LRQRSQEALRLKAARGDLHTTVAAGYVRSADDRLELDPDKRVREAIYLAFRKFAEFASIRQVAIWLCDEGVKMPIVVYGLWHGRQRQFFCRPVSLRADRRARLGLVTKCL
jgi:hypothetical protein